MEVPHRLTDCHALDYDPRRCSVEFSQGMFVPNLQIVFVLYGGPEHPSSFPMFSII